MELSFTEKKSIRKNFGKLKEILSLPNLIEVQKKSYKQSCATERIPGAEKKAYSAPLMTIAHWQRTVHYSV